MSRLRVLIVDDEPIARRHLRVYLDREPDLVVLGECAGGREAVTAIRERKPDLVFLDVQMPDLDGFEVLARLPPDDLPAIIFVTAHDEYAIRAFRVEALDYSSQWRRRAPGLQPRPRHDPAPPTEPPKPRRAATPLRSTVIECAS